MATTFYEFSDGSELKQGNVIVGLSNDATNSTNQKFNFPGTGFKDQYGNYLLSYSSTAATGPSSANYPALTASGAGFSVVYGCAGIDSQIEVGLESKGTGNLFLSTEEGFLVINGANGEFAINDTDEFTGVSDDGTLASNSHTLLTTQYAVKTYVDAQVAGSVDSVTGTANRITISGTAANPIVDIAATYVGQTSITTLGTITSGTWNATLLTPTYGGTGVNNGSSTLTLAANLATSGAFASTFTFTAPTTVTFPTSGTLATTTGTITTATNLAGGTTNDIPYQTAAGTTNFITETANGVLIYSAGGVPSSSTTLPSGLSATSINLTTPVLGTPTSGTLTNCTGLPIATGVSGLGSGIATFLATPTSANLAAAVTNETGSGSLVFATSPTLVTPLLGTPTSGVLTSCTGLPLTTGVTGILPSANGGTGVNNGSSILTLAGNLSTVGAFASTFTMTNTTSVTFPTSGTLATTTGTVTTATNLAGGTANDIPYQTAAGTTSFITETNNGVLVYSGAGVPSSSTTLPSGLAATSINLTTPLLGTPTSGTLTNCTGLPISTGISGLGTGIATFLVTPSSANLATAVTDETGSGSLVFATSPTLVTPLLGTPTSGILNNCTGLPIATGVSGLGSGVANFLATPSSANLAAAITDETGSGALVFAGSPVFTTQITTPTVVRTGATDSNTKFTANSGVAITIDPANGPYQEITLTANTTITMTTVPGSTLEREIVLNLIQDATGGRTVAWANIAFATNSGSTPTISSGIGNVTTISIIGTSAGWNGYCNNGLGLTTGSAPITGFVGETLTASVAAGSAVSLTTATVTEVTNIAYTAGNWIVYANPTFIGTGITTTELQAFLSTASGTSTTGQDTFNTSFGTPFIVGATARDTTPIVGYPFNVSSAGTLYLKAKATFSLGSCTAFGGFVMVRAS